MTTTNQKKETKGFFQSKTNMLGSLSIIATMYPQIIKYIIEFVAIFTELEGEVNFPPIVSNIVTLITIGCLGMIIFYRTFETDHKDIEVPEVVKKRISKVLK